MFAVVVDVGGAPVNVGNCGGMSRVVEVGSRSLRVVFVCANGEAGPTDAEASGIQHLAGRYWIVGRIRLDAREELRERLSQVAGGDFRQDGDALLCLRAYAAWGAGFVERLAGDFCFALWDDARGLLVCARDRLGVRPLFHAAAGDRRFVGDSLDWIRSRLPAGGDLDDFWIADFLTVNCSLEVERTVYKNVHRLAPAHLLELSEAGQVVRRYWRLAIGEPLRLRGRGAYVERFLELLDSAMANRLPDGRVGISMSGGLDSTTLAACAVRAAGDPARVVAECLHFETLMPDEEKHFSMLVARHLGIDLVQRARDDLTYDPAWRTRPIHTAEPCLSIVRAEFDRQIAREQQSRAPVWLYGEGPDNALLFERGAYISWLVERRDWWRLAEVALLNLAAKGLDGWGPTLRRLARPRRAVEDEFAVPPWLDRGLVEDLRLQERLRGASAAATSRHPWHPKAVASFGDPIWPRMLDAFDYDEALSPIVWRHPFLDLRVLEFMLSIPPLPWGRRKLILRQAMRGRLPAEVLARNKTPLAGSPLAEPLRRHGLPELARDGRFGRYVDSKALPAASSFAGYPERLVAAHALDHWLAQGTTSA
jgi:asparagine synthase (glutamine-hydrolysing)